MPAYKMHKPCLSSFSNAKRPPGAANRKLAFNIKLPSLQYSFCLRTHSDHIYKKKHGRIFEETRMWSFQLTNDENHPWISMRCLVTRIFCSLFPILPDWLLVVFHCCYSMKDKMMVNVVRCRGLQHLDLFFSKKYFQNIFSFRRRFLFVCWLAVLNTQ
jgi:hypothetical protein